MESKGTSFEGMDYGGSHLLEGIHHVQSKVAHFKEKVKEFYFLVLLGNHECPKCGGGLVMVGPSQCGCACGNFFDPTLAFQRSLCCGATLVRKTFHYVCSRCHQTVASRFLFDERLFDKAYFQEMMQESRARAKRKREEIRLLLSGSRSDPLSLAEDPRLDSIPGLTEALNDFIGTEIVGDYKFGPKSGFRMDDYRNHILTVLGVGSRLFSEISPLADDYRRDKIWRFITLIFMTQDREVELTQFGADILVERVAGEAHF